MKSLILTGGKVFGGAGWAPPVWYDSILLEDGLIIAVGEADQVRSAGSAAGEVALDGSLVLPGLCDAHLHLSAGGRLLQTVDLEGLDCEGVRQALSVYANSPDCRNSKWIEAFNWEPWLCQLDADELDKLLPGRDVVVFARDLHSLCCNSAVLTKAGINVDTPDPPGGIIERCDDGSPDGIIREAAMASIREISPLPTTGDVEAAILKAQDYVLSLGLTAISDVVDEEIEAVYRDLDVRGKLEIDIDAWLRIDKWSVGSPPPDNGERFRINTLKIFLDGSLGSRTAALSEPYTDEPDRSGVLHYSDDRLLEELKPAVETGWRLAFHAIGDRAVAQACRVLRQLPPSSFGPHRIEHVQIMPEDGIRMMVESEAVASVQPVHLIDDQRWLSGRISRKLCRSTSVWRSLVEAGVPLALGSDWPVASPDPCLNIHAAVNRSCFGEKPNDCFDEREALTPHQAVRSASYGWALAAGVDAERGAIVPGQSADLTVLTGVSDDLADWSEAEVVMTVSRGKIVYSK